MVFKKKKKHQLTDEVNTSLPFPCSCCCMHCSAPGWQDTVELVHLCFCKIFFFFNLCFHVSHMVILFFTSHLAQSCLFILPDLQLSDRVASHSPSLCVLHGAGSRRWRLWISKVTLLSLITAGLFSLIPPKLLACRFPLCCHLRAVFGMCKSADNPHA